MVAVSNRTATLFAIAHVIFASLLGAAGLLTVLTDCGLILLNVGAVLASGAWIVALSRDSELHGGEGDHAHEGATTSATLAVKVAIPNPNGGKDFIAHLDESELEET